MTDVYVGSDDSARSDAELILDVRGGDLEAFGALYVRHVPAARAVARQYVRSAADADDLVSEAFHRVLSVLQHGGGPDATFRAYLLTVVRRLAADLARGVKRTRPTADDGTFEAALGVVDSTDASTFEGFEHSVVKNAYQALPERWQAVLWYTEIEGRAPAEVAPILGLTPNGVSALAYRAREGLRVGYLQEHLTHAPSDGCRAVNPLLGAYVRGGLARREVARVDTHLETCAECRALVLELGDIAHGMRSVVAPLIVGLAGMAVLGALPIGGSIGGAFVGAGSSVGGAVGGGAAAGGSTSVGTVVGSATSTTVGASGAGGAAGISTGAAASAGVGTTAATTAATGTASLAGAATAGVATGSAATAATAGTAAAAGAVMGTAGVAAAASAVAVATVGVVTVLNALSATHEPPPAAPPVAVTIPGAPWVLAPWEQPDDAAVEAAGGDDDGTGQDAGDDTTIDPAADATNPANVLAISPFTPQADLAVSTSADALEPRAVQPLVLTVSNTGSATASEAVVEVALPAGLDLALPDGPSGASIGATFDGDALSCTPADDGARTARCVLGTIEPGQSRTGSVPVRANAGGSYLVGASVWADGLQPEVLTLPATTVLHYGAELTAAAGDAVALSNPGAAWVPVTVQNTGDQAATAWSVLLTVPAGLRPVGSDGDLTCVPGGATNEGGVVWTCVAAADAAPLAPGEQRSVRLRVVADGAATPGTVSVSASPQLPGSTHALTGSAAVAVAQPWASAASGARSVQARCATVGGVSSASAVVEGTYVNLTDQTLALRLDAAESAATAAQQVAPGESVTVQVPDGLRVPAGGAVWTVSTTLAGETYRTSVPAGQFQSAECYSPRWDVDTSATTTNGDGRVQVRGTLTNTGDEPVRAGMTAAGISSEEKRLAVGETATFVVQTDRTSLAAGAASFQLYRWVADADGDQPAQGVVPAVAPTTGYAAATIAPAVAERATLTADECRFDVSADTSRRTVRIAVDNSGSTLPVRFAVSTASADGRAVMVDGGATGVLEVSVPWNTRTLTVTADGSRLGTVDVPAFDGCATAAWPSDTVDVSVATRCVDDRAQAVVNVRNRGSVGWDAALADGDAGSVAAGSGTTLVEDLGGIQADRGTVRVRLSREIEDRNPSVERTFDHDAVSCVVVAPQAGLELGDVQVEKQRWRTMSTRSVTVVLDNTGSSVPQDFSVRGPNGVSVDVTVPARESVRADGGTVVGRHGATYTVRAGDWSTELVVDRFTGVEWCADPARRGGGYEVGDVASWRGGNYRYTGTQAWTGAVVGAPAIATDQGRWSGDHGPRRWERVGDCEYA